MKAINQNKQQCFVVMPFGRDRDEKRWFKAWYHEVIEPAVTSAGYSCILAAMQEQPEAINDEIRYHLAKDDMVVVDLGGMEATDDPNPNVMYELGIRHAFDLPVVIMAWQDQSIPFDVSNQRVVMTDRHPVNFGSTRETLKKFISAAKEGKYYRPMQAIQRASLLELASQNLSEDNILHTLVDEVRSLHKKIEKPIRSNAKKPLTLKRAFMSTKALRRPFYTMYKELGGKDKYWNKITGCRIDEQFVEKASEWEESSWRAFFEVMIETYADEETTDDTSFTLRGKTEQESQLLLEAVKEELPDQPWPKGTHKQIREKFELSGSEYQKCIDALIERGDYLQQEDGRLIEKSA